MSPPAQNGKFKVKRKLSSIENGIIKVNSLVVGSNAEISVFYVARFHTHTHTHSQWPPHGNKARGNVTASPPMESL